MRYRIFYCLFWQILSLHLRELSVQGTIEISGKNGLAEEVYDHLKKEIMSTRLAPGTALIEVTLAQSLGISRTPVREALRRLKMDGLVDIDRGRGARVSQVSFRNALEVYEIRMLVEPYAAAKAAQNFSPEEQVRFQELRDMLASPALTSDSLERWNIDRDLHDAIFQVAGNELLRSLVWDLRIRTERAFTYYGAMRDLQATRSEHLQVIGAILSRDGAHAEESMRMHISNSLARLTAR